MRFALLTSLVLASGCALSTDHVSTKVLRICADDVPLLFSADAGGMVASTKLEGVGRAVDDDAHAALDTLVLEPIGDPNDLFFAESIVIELSAPGSDFPDLRLAEDPALDATSPVTVAGDPSANMAGYLAVEELWLRLRLAGDAPTDMFAARAHACLDVEGVEVEDPP